MCSHFHCILASLLISCRRYFCEHFEIPIDKMMNRLEIDNDRTRKIFSSKAEKKNRFNCHEVIDELTPKDACCRPNRCTFVIQLIHSCAHWTTRVWMRRRKKLLLFVVAQRQSSILRSPTPNPSVNLTVNENDENLSVSNEERRNFWTKCQKRK